MIDKIGGQIFFDSFRKMLVIGGRRYEISETLFVACKALIQPATFVVVCLCDGVVNSVETDTDIDNAVCFCIKDKELPVLEIEYSIVPIDCPVCLQNDMDSKNLLSITDIDMDELNYDGLLILECRVCGTRFSGHLELSVVERNENV